MIAVRFTLALFILCLASQASARTLTIGVDLSRSNPLVMSPAFARVAASYAKTQIMALQAGDVVHIKTFGERGLVNFPSERIEISRRNRADKVADTVARFIASLPSRSTEGQGSTNIIAFLEFGSFDCADEGRILLLTDGLESSAYIDARSLIAGKALPPPENNLLSGCEVTMLGFGQSRDGALPPQAIKNAKAAWAAWMKAADASFNPVIDP